MTTMKPTDFDILLGRSKQSFHHVGNQAFRELIANNVERYALLSTKREKMTTVSTILEVITEGGGKFLKQASDGQFIHVEPKVSKEKISHALRDQLSQKRFQHVRSNNDLSSFEVPSASSDDCWRTIVQQTRKENFLSTPAGLLKAATTFSRQDQQSSDPWYNMLLKNSDKTETSSDALPRIVSLESSSTEATHEEEGGANAEWAFPPQATLPTLLSYNKKRKQHPSHLENILHSMDMSPVVVEQEHSAVNNSSSKMPATKLSPLQSFLNGPRMTTAAEPISDVPKPVSKMPRFASNNHEDLESLLNGPLLTSTEEPSPDADLPRRVSADSNMEDNSGQPVEEGGPNALWDSPLSFKPSLSSSPPLPEDLFLNMSDDMPHVVEEDDMAPIDGKVEPQFHMALTAGFDHICEAPPPQSTSIECSSDNAHLGSNAPLFSLQFEDKVLEDPRIELDKGHPCSKPKPLDRHRVWDQDDECLSTSSCDVTSVDMMSVTLDIASIDLSADDLSIASLPSASSSLESYTDPQLDDMIVELFGRTTAPLG